jgi:predicted O-linked N-acetylglucosamine transferase (SPINDLY family)
MASPNTLLMNAAASLRARKYAQAEQYLVQALRIDTRNCPARYQLAQLHAMRGDTLGAVALLEEIMAIDPGHLDACKALAGLHGGMGNAIRAEACYRHAARLAPDDAALVYNLGVFLQGIGRLDESAICYERAALIKPDFVQAYNNLGNVHLRLGNPAAAAENARRAIAVDAGMVEAHYNMGMALAALGEVDGALASYQEALRLQPKDAEIMMSMGALLNNNGQRIEAETWYRRALACNPNYYAALFNLGCLLAARGDVDSLVEAEAMYRLAAAQRDDFTEAHFLLGRVLEDLGQREPWLEVYRQAPAPRGEAWLLYHLYSLKAGIYGGDFALLDAALAALLNFDYQPADLPHMGSVFFYMQSLDVDQADLYRIYRRMDELARQATGDRVLCGRPRVRAACEKIRLGYVSGDFNYHVMGWIMADVLAHHDRDRYTLYLYSVGGKEDEFTEHFRALADNYVSLRDMEARQAAERIAADELDILVDLIGHTTKTQALLYAYKPAPLQLTHLGYHGALGLSAVDYKISDAHADVPENARFMVEKLLPMRGCLMPFHHEEPASDGPTRASLGVAENAILLAVFVHISKLSRRCLATWKRILDELPNACLAFSPLLSFERPSYERLLAAAGIPLDRLVFIPAQRGLPEGRARYRLVDLALDTFPYSGGDTSMAALDMAIPIVTLRGWRQCERMTYSILKHLGLEACIADSEDDYVRIVVDLARDARRRAEVARTIPNLLVSSGMADMGRYTAHLEAAFEAALASVRPNA